MAFAIGGLVLLAIIGYIIHRQQRTIKALRKASHVKSKFLATMSHEIRTPVSIIIGMLELMMQPQKNSAQNQQFLRVSQDAAQQLLLLIGNILDVSRIESGRMVLRPERTTLRPLLLSTATQFEGLAKQKALRFMLDIDAGLTDDVLIDTMRLRQIVLNLLGNAIKFTDKGDVIFRAQQDWRDRKNLMLKLEVEDTGSDIDDASRQRLFRPFAQGINSQVDQGSGLGLFICHTLTKMMNGDITVTSGKGKGTRVTVLLKLPLIASSLTMPILQREQSAPSLTLNILIVDDNPAGLLTVAMRTRHWPSLTANTWMWLSVTVICREWTVMCWHIAFVRLGQILCCLALRQTHDHPLGMKLKNPEWTTVCLSRFHWQCWRSY